MSGIKDLFRSVIGALIASINFLAGLVLFSFILLLTKVVQFLYFERVRLKGVEKLPESGPVIYAANHPQTLVDAVLLLNLIGHRSYFLALGSLFRFPFCNWFLQRIHLIPVMNKIDREVLCANPRFQTWFKKRGRTAGRQNQMAFMRAAALLLKGKALIVFPTGSRESGTLLSAEVQAGFANIALLSEDIWRSDGVSKELGIPIVPIGISYSRPGRFRCKAEISVGAPLSSASYYEAYKKNKRAGRKLLLRDFENALRDCCTWHDRRENDELVRGLDLLYHERALDSRLRQQAIIETVNAAQQDSPEILAEVEVALSRYLLEAQSLKISPGSEYRRNSRLRHCVLTALIPFYLLARALHLLPTTATALLAARSTEPGWKGTYRLIGGSVSFLVWLNLIAVLSFLFVGSLGMSAFVVLCLSLSGVFTCSFFRTARLWAAQSSLYGRAQRFREHLQQGDMLRERFDAVAVKALGQESFALKLGVVNHL